MLRSILFAGLVFFLSSNASAQAAPDIFAEKLPSQYGKRELPVFETNPELLSPALARERLEAALKSLQKDRKLFDRDSKLLLRHVQDDQNTWQGELRSDPDVEYAFDLRTGRLEIVDHGVHQLPVVSSQDSVQTIKDAKAVAMTLIDALDRDSVINRQEFDLEDIDVAIEKTGFGEVGKAIDPRSEIVTRYLITAKRRINGIPVIGSFVRVGVHQSGAFSDLVVAYRPLRASFRGDQLVPSGMAKSASVDLSPEQAQEQLRERMSLSPESWLNVERWGLVYFDSGSSQQRYYQPVYAFLVVPLTKNTAGTIAGRKVVRIIPASTNVFEELKFDPLHPAADRRPTGDQRQPR